MNQLLPLAAAARLLLAAPPTQTSVELRVTSVDEGEAKLLEQVLLRQLGNRLLEDGYRVVPAGEAASVRVWIHLGVDEATIETHGDGQRIEQVSEAEPEVMALELQQLATALIDAVQPADAEPIPAVALELRGDGSDAQLRERLQMGLLERGFALTRTPGPEDLRLCVTLAAAGTRVHAVAGLDACDGDDTGMWVEAAPTIEMARELLLDQASATLERALTQPSTEPVPEPIEPSREQLLPVDIEPRRDDERPESGASRSVGLSLSAGAGVLGRGGGSDALVVADLRAGLRRGLGGQLSLGLAPSRADRLRVIDWMPAAGLDWRLPFADRGLAILAAFAGVHVHAYRYTDAASSGVRMGPHAGASVRLAYLGRLGALLFGGVRAGWSGGSWVHLDEGTPSWRRSGVFVGIELGAGWDIELGARR